MRILILNSWADDWDIERVKGSPKNAYILSGFLKRRWKLTMIAPKGERGYPEPFRIIRVSRRGYGGGNKYLAYFKEIINYILFNLSLYRSGKKILFGEKFDGIIGIGEDTAISLHFLRKKFKIPAIMKIPGVRTLNSFHPLAKGIPHYYKCLIALSLPFDKFLLVDDGSEAQKVAERMGIEKGRYVHLPNCYPEEWKIEEGERRRLRKELGVSDREVLIGWASRLGAFKGVNYLSILVKETLLRRDYSKFLIAGNGGIDKLKIDLHNGRIKFIGLVPHIKMLEFFTPIDIFISTNIYANFTLPVIEAQYLGIPVVTFDVGETRKAVLDGITGYLIPPFDVNLFLDKLIHLIDNAELRKEMGERAREFVKKNHISWKELIDKESKVVVDTFKIR
jgi:glycosyltransferase involved in cell wall biosynthesis